MDLSAAYNISLIDEMYARYAQDPQSIDPSWRHFFEGMAFAGTGEGHSKDVRILNLIDAYRTYGHLYAHVNPLTLAPKALPRELSLITLGFKESERQESFPTLGLLDDKQASLDTIVNYLQKTYCKSIGIEYMNLQSPEMEKWLQKEIEPSQFRPQFSSEKKIEILEQLHHASLFEAFLHTKYVGQKRFSLEGGESLIPVLHEIIESGAEKGIEEFVIGMPHRGRLNVLTTILKKSYAMVFSEFEDYYEQWREISGDVKYHKGYSATITTRSGKEVHISVVANASHLESVDPIVLGKTRAKQVIKNDPEKKKVCAILIHGDASLAGQGVVYECLQHYKLENYNVGGTIHIVSNNQIGFTTVPEESRSVSYCTAIASSFNAPVFHANCEDPEGCVYAANLALNIRQHYACDVFIDLNGYRKYGHNESDEPSFTQPLQYEIIRKKRSIRELYLDHLVEEGVIDQKKMSAFEEAFRKTLADELQASKERKQVFPDEAFAGVWQDYSDNDRKIVDTTVAADSLRKLTHTLSTIPEGFNLHPKIDKLLKAREEMVAEKESLVDWAMAEQLAFASLLAEKIPVRLSGQDAQRGTFSQRHAVWVDQQSGRKYFPLAHLIESQGRFDVINTPLSEYAAVGIELGYSMAHPEGLVIWEAQYGDFANGAQIIFDQYLSSSAQKWSRYSGLTLYLPHGYEGHGPEHSSARIERFLQLSGNLNWHVVYPTTAVQLFHLLRRQALRPFRKPLVIFTPKGLLRYSSSFSPFYAFSKGSFSSVLDDPKRGNETRRILLCTGKVYYDLIAARAKMGLENKVAVVRIEELYPFPEEKVRQIVSGCEHFWVQEEPQNMGAASYVQRYLKESICVARADSSATACGSHELHIKEQQILMELAFEGVQL